jgi:[ribosomal protein S18]-alanine N-acetyltransferase
LNIRPARLKDFDELLFIEEQAHIYPWPESTLHWCLEQPHLRCFVLEQQRDIIGFAIYECVLDEATLLNIAINPNYQGQGFGRALLRQSLLALDATIARTFLEVRISNETALRLYQSENFVEIGQRRNYYPTASGREDARVFELDLDVYRLNH